MTHAWPMSNFWTDKTKCLSESPSIILSRLMFIRPDLHKLSNFLTSNVCVYLLTPSVPLHATPLVSTKKKKCERNRLEKYWLKTFSSMVESFLQWRLCNGHKTSKSTVSRQPRQQYAQEEEKLSDTGAGGAGTYTTRETQELSGLLRLVQTQPTSVHTTTAGHPHVCGGMDHPDGLGGGMATRKYLHQPVFQWPMYHTVSTTLYRVYKDPLQGSSLYKWPSLVKHARSRLTKSIVHTWTWQCTVNGTQM